MNANINKPVSMRSIMSAVIEQSQKLAEQNEMLRRSIIAADGPLCADELDDRYNPEGNGEHPLFSRQDWRSEVALGDTSIGYWDWVERQIAHETAKLTEVDQQPRCGCPACADETTSAATAPDTAQVADMIMASLQQVFPGAEIKMTPISG